MADEEVELKLMKLKTDAAEANILYDRRNELIETLNKLNIEIPSEVRPRVEDSTDYDDEYLQMQLMYYSAENRTLENYLSVFLQSDDELSMVKKENSRLKTALKIFKTSEIDKAFLEKYVKRLNERIHTLEKEKYQLLDILLYKECEIDIMTCKLSHLICQLQEPIMELRQKEKENVPLSDEDVFLIRIAEMSATNSNLKPKIDELKNLNSNLLDKYQQLQKETLQKLKDLEGLKESCDIFEEDQDRDRVSTGPPSMSTSYTQEIFLMCTKDKPHNLALIGLRAAEMVEFHRKIEAIRKQNCIQNRINPWD